MNFYLITLIKAFIVFGALMTTLAYLQWIERKVLAHIQIRLGPQRVGPHGLLQPLADVIKLMTKEDLMPSHVNKLPYLLAPFVAVTLSLISIAVIPFGPEIELFGVRTQMQLADIGIGVLLILAVSSMSVYGIALAGWSSNNKYALLGGLRAAAQMVSYELPMALGIAAPLLLFNSLSFREIAEKQGGFAFGFLPQWAIFQGPFPQIVSFIIFLIAIFAETNRVPFDLPEAENELVAGFHTEYSSMKFASFFMAEYANILTACCVAVTLFLGSWHPLFPVEYGSNYAPSVLFLLGALACFWYGLKPVRRRDRISLPVFGLVFLGLAAAFLAPAVQYIGVPVFWFVAKVGVLIFIFVWVRGTLPRFHYDQLMRFAWTFMFPVAIVNLLVTAFLVAVYA